MKLLDLQTRKYLQSNEDWLNGNNYIYIIQSDNDNDNEDEDCVEAEEYVDGKTISAKMYKRSTPEGILQDICSKTWAYLYGGRYLLEQTDICKYEIIYKISYPNSIHAEIPRDFPSERDNLSLPLKNLSFISDLLSALPLNLYHPLLRATFVQRNYEDLCFISLN